MKKLSNCNEISCLSLKMLQLCVASLTQNSTLLCVRPACWRAPESVIITSVAPLRSTSHHCVRCLKLHRVVPTVSRHSLQHKAKEHSHLLRISHQRWQISHILNMLNTYTIYCTCPRSDGVAGGGALRHTLLLHKLWIQCLRHERESKDKRCALKNAMKESSILIHGIKDGSLVSFHV